ncbi:MAG: GrpB family protein [Acutalibacteraceae bacterium]
MIGLKKDTVALLPHDPEWGVEAEKTSERLKQILGDAVVDIQHIGSTSIPSICAKPIIDLAVGVRSFDNVLKYNAQLEADGFYYRPGKIDDQLLYACGSYYDGTGDLQSHFVHVVLYGSKAWVDYINFRDYLIAHADVAKAYESLKLQLAQQTPCDPCRENYIAGKHDFIAQTLRTALVRSYLGKTVQIEIDRPIGYVHKKENYSLVYPINYGYIPGVIGGDGEELDVYLLGVDEPVERYLCKIIGIAFRANDVEDKLIAAPIGYRFTKEAVAAAVHFQEQWYNTTFEVIQ